MRRDAERRGEFFEGFFTDYVPLRDGIDNKFTSADLNKKKRIPKEKASLLLGILNKLGIIEMVGKQGRYYVYSKLK